ncbi:ShlB/FhaC/HecB family hemolysin secretion/activation protein [Yersinia sp. 1652 StPb PI]|uniref:ShlB/FhaC/HecB family hemolysin secretion/activation protein n=1 Tax=Yersinia sp. 1652 StPb PI TaxID=3061649 RepID=UPI00355B00E6
MWKYFSIYIFIFSHGLYANELNESSTYSNNFHQNHASENTLVVEDKCLNITGFYFRGNMLFIDDQFETPEYSPDRCITIYDANQLARNITNTYLTKGYVAARVSFLPRNSKGELGLNINEGVVERIEGGDRRVNHKFLFPNVEGKPLKLSNIEQAIDQANRLRSNKVKLDVLPGSVEGMSIIRVNNIDAKPWSVTASVNNYGYKKTDEWKANTSLSWDSPLGWSDFVNFNVSRTLENAKKRYKQEYSLFYSVPYGDFTFSTAISDMQYRRYDKPTTRIIKFSGGVQQYSFETDFMFYRNSRQINTLSSTLKHKKGNSFINDTKVNVNSYQFTSLELGVNHFHIIPNGSMNFNFSVEKGLPWLDFSNNKYAQNRDFTKSKMIINLNRRFHLFDSPYQINSSLVGEYSRKPLMASERLSLTDRNALRGFSGETLSGDSGWYLKNTLSRYFWLGETTVIPRVGVDSGRVLSHGSKQGWQSNVGLSAGLALYYKSIQFDLEASRGFWLSDNNKRSEPVQYLLKSSYTF